MHFLILFSLINLSASFECGKTTISPKTNKQHFPWTAEIYSTVIRTKAGNFQHLCGSSIISSLFAVSASHCIDDKYSTYRRSEGDIFLIANLYDLKDQSGSVRINVRKIYIHPSWNPENENFDGDISLLKFEETLSFENDKISPICLWKMGDEIKSIEAGKIMTFIALEEEDPGYYNYQHDKTHNYPIEYTMPIRDNCTKIQRRFASISSENTFCAGGLNSGACLETGSSGSSMSVEYNETFYLRGIVSASFIDFAGCDNYTFTLFTDVLKYRDWIDGILSLA